MDTVHWISSFTDTDTGNRVLRVQFRGVQGSQPQPQVTGCCGYSSWRGWGVGVGWGGGWVGWGGGGG